MSRLFGENRRILSTWFLVWSGFLLVSWAAIGFYVQRGWTQLQNWDTVSMDGSFPGMAEPLWMGGLLVWLVLLIFDAILYTIRVKKPLKNAINSLILEGPVDDIEVAKSKSTGIITISSIASTLLTLGSAFITMSRFEKSKNWLKHLPGFSKLEPNYKWVAAAIIGAVVILTVISFLMKLSFKKCLTECMSYYGDKNICFFFCNEAGVSKLWIGMISMSFFLLTIGAAYLFGGTVWLSKWTKVPKDQFGKNQWVFKGTATIVGILFLLSIVNVIAYYTKGSSKVKLALEKELSDSDIYEVSKVKGMLNMFLAFEIWFAVLCLLGGAGMFLVESTSNYGQRIFKGGDAMLKNGTAGIICALFIFWLPVFSTQLQIKGQFKKISESETSRNLKLGASNVDL